MVAVVIAVLVALVVGFGIGRAASSGGSDSDKPAATTGGTLSPSSTPESSEPIPTEDPTEPSRPAKLGTESDLRALKVTALEYRHNITGSDGYGPDPGHRWDAALVKVCNTGVKDEELIPQITSYGNWSAVDGQDGSYTELDLTPSPAPLPQWDNEKKITVGTCARGWLALDLTPDTRVVALTYSVEGKEYARWAIGG
jgi:hypothetical protein